MEAGILVFIVAAFVGGVILGWHFPQPSWIKTPFDK
jgi:hypothetical protein